MLIETEGLAARQPVAKRPGPPLSLSRLGPMPIKAVVWDVDDTLFDYTTADREGMRAHLVAEGLLAGYGSAEEALVRWRQITDRQWARFSAGEVDFVTQRRDRIREFLGRPELTEAEADAWFQRYVTHYEAVWSLFPDVVPVLDALAGSHRHAVLSNSSLTVQDRKLRVLGVHDRFETILCAAELGVSKPEPAAFLAACDALALPGRGRLRRRPPGDRRTRRRRGRAALRVDRPGRRLRDGGTAGGAAPYRLPLRTPRAARRRYPFWSPVHLRVMFFLRRRGAGRKGREPEARR